MVTEENQIYVSGRLEIANMTEFYKAAKETRFLPDDYVTYFPHLNEFAITKLSIKSKLGERKLRYGRLGNHLFRSNHQRCSVEKGVLKNVAQFDIFKSTFFIEHFRTTDSIFLGVNCENVILKKVAEDIF